GGRQASAANENRDDADAALQRHGQLEPNSVVRLQQAGVALRRRRIEPAWADDRQYGVRVMEGVIDRLLEGFTERDRCDVLEDALRTQVLAEPVSQATGVTSDITSPVAKENLHRSVLPRRPPRYLPL